MKNTLTQLLNIRYPIIQAGMVWCSGYKLAAAVSNAGGLGLLGSGSMQPDLLEEHIIKCKKTTKNTFGVNIPLLYPHAAEVVEVVIKHKVPVVFTSAGNPATYTAVFKKHGIIVVHVVSSTKFAIKAADCGVDALVAEGFEAGGHNGKEETTTLCLLPLITSCVSLPIIAAGGIASGRAMLACMAMGAQGVQIGSAFAVATESSAHINFKQKILECHEGDTMLTLKNLVPTRMIKNAYYEQLNQLLQQTTDTERIKSFVGKGRSKMGIFEGNLTEGELEIGQVCAQIKHIEPAAVILQRIWNEFLQAHQEVKKWKLK